MKRPHNYRSALGEIVGLFTEGDHPWMAFVIVLAIVVAVPASIYLAGPVVPTAALTVWGAIRKFGA